MKIAVKLILSIIFVDQACFLSAQETDREESISLGEKLNYDIKYGVFKVGEAEAMIDPELFYPDQAPHYLVTIKVSSVGLLKFFYSNLHLCYETYISVDNSIPFTSERELYHGKEVEIEHDYFRYEDSVYVENQRFKTGEIRKRSFDNSDRMVRDVLSTYVFFRNSEMSKMVEEVPIFFYLYNRLNELVVKPTEGVVDFEGTPSRKFNLLFPRIKDFPNDKESYVFMSMDGRNVPLKIKLGTKRGNFYLLLNKKF